MDRHEVADSIRRSGVVGIVRAKTQRAGLDTALTLLDAGLPVVEISLVTPGAMDAIREVRKRGIGVVGAGTVLDESSARAAIEAGAEFLVAPTLNPRVIRTALRYNIVSLPGVATPTEAVRAIELGADFSKLFPASMYGPNSVRDMLTALPQIPLVPTGGIDLADVAAYIRAGSAAVGLGSALSQGTAEEIGARVAALLEEIKSARNT